MAILSLLLLLLFLTVVFPLRAMIRKARFGSAGRASYSRERPNSWWLADLLFLTGFGLVIAGPALVLTDVLDQLFEPAGPALAAILILIFSATGLAVWSQQVMGAAWRPDIATQKPGRLVTSGPFRLVRNPNYVAMLAAATGATLLAPTWIGSIGLALLTVGLILTARAEEDQLKQSYGRSYQSYAAATGRFIPGIGRLSLSKQKEEA